MEVSKIIPIFAALNQQNNRMMMKQLVMTVVLVLVAMTGAAQNKTIGKQLRETQQRVAKENVFYQKYDNVAPEKILQTILDKYKGKTVLIDVWATWCGPCRAGHQALKPMKEEMKGKNVQFVYITSPTSPLDTWQEMIKDIDGDHYYLTKEQYLYVLEKYESQGIPTYVVYDAKGNQTYKEIGFPGPEPIKNAVEKAVKGER